MSPLPPRGLPPAKPFPKPITTPPKPDNPPCKSYAFKKAAVYLLGRSLCRFVSSRGLGMRLTGHP